MADYPLDERLKEWASPAQAKYLDAINLHGSARKAATALGVDRAGVSRAMQRLQRIAAENGYAPGHFSHGVAPGYRMGKVTVQRGADGLVERVWERQHPTADAEGLKSYVEGLVSQAPDLAPLTSAPIHTDADLLSVYAFGDPHFGMYAWADETGDDFDLDTADRLTRGAIDRLVSSSPPSKRALLLQVGDLTHADDSRNQTPGHGHALDVDTRFAKVMMVTAQAQRHVILRMLEKHEEVTVWMVPGNHDPHTSFAIALALAFYFENEPRVTVDLSPSLYRYLRHGKVLIGAHHGHGAKQADLPLLMAVDRPEDWGASLFRFVYMGHIHHDTVKEVQGVRVESIRTLAGKDAWHAGKGYRSGRDARVIVHHADFGEVERHTCNVAMIG